MSIDFESWLGGTTPLLPTPTEDAPLRAVGVWRRILDKPSSVTFRTALGASVAAQTVRLEWDNTASLIASEAGSAPRALLIVFGVRSHPTIADTDMAEGYRFNFEGDAYRIIEVIKSIGEIQGVAEVVG